MQSQRPSAVKVIIAINVLVFVAWQAAARSDGLARFMITNFLVSSAHIEAGYVWTLLTSAFSHEALMHLAINMFVLWSFGTTLERIWGRRVFVAFYLIAGVVASACHCLVSTYYLGDGTVAALGASGAVSGLLVAFALHFPRAKILIFGIIPMPALVGALAFVALDIWGLVKQAQGGGLPIGHGAHLGGALAGTLMYAFYLRKHFPTRTPPTEVRFTMEEAVELRRIREKAEQGGVETLTPAEHEFLERLRDRVGSTT
ncbi:MAG: rhomboid family intramembrane serine protease [Planctomycetota bacterium]|jgi:rhomboid-like protein